MTPGSPEAGSPIEERDQVLDERQEAYNKHVLPEVATLLRVALCLSTQQADAEDLVQETLLCAWRSIDTFDGRHPRAWLLTILRNANLKAHRRRRPSLLDDPESPIGNLGRDEGIEASAEDLVMDATFDDLVEEALSALSPKLRQTVLLVDVDRLTYAEAAAVLGIPAGTVMSRLHRARTFVRVHLETPRQPPTDDGPPDGTTAGGRSDG